MTTPLWLARVRVTDRKDTVPVRELLRSRVPIARAIGSGKVYVDERLGYAISARNPAGGGWPRGVEVLLAARDVAFRLAKHADPPVRPGKLARASNLSGGAVLAAAAVPPEPSLTVVRLGGWPTALTGTDIRVAVLDSGIGKAVPQLPRLAGGIDFNSAEGPKAPPSDTSSNSHGTKCAGVIGARYGASRRSVAPASEIFAAQITSGQSGTYTKMSNLHLMLSWALDMEARVVNMSFNAEQASTIDKASFDIFSGTVAALRGGNRALVFASAQEGSDRLSFPASAPGVVAVGLYKTDPGSKGNGKGNGKAVVYRIDTPAQWDAKNGDLVFGPGDKATTVDVTGAIVKFGDLSAACAFVSGVAALYMQRYTDKNADDILKAMRADADKVAAVDSAPGDNLRLCVRFPK